MVLACALAVVEGPWLLVPRDFDELGFGYDFADLGFAYSELGLTFFSRRCCCSIFLCRDVFA